MLFLSAGHDPRAPGVVWKGVREHDLAVEWVRELARLIPAAKVVPVTTLGARIRWINADARPADLAVEIHMNGAANPAARGSEALYNPGSTRGERIAAGLQAAQAAHFAPSRGHKAGTLRMELNGPPLAFLDDTVCTAVILEPEFIFHHESIRDRRDACCADLARVLRAYA
jgi:N-acetylmuramoyl-L-alanine amidase